ncbi:MAG TPA: amidohydrolase family protein [Mycobacteriales bacterium]|nr:amidohydrolase family protein [Mycobacteriales bacterium]
MATVATVIVDARVRLPESVRPAAAHEAAVETREGYGAVFENIPLDGMTPEELTARMADAAVDHAVVHAEYEGGNDVADALNEAVAALVASAPDRFSGVGTVDLARLDVARAQRQLDRCVELGLLGVNIQPAFFDLDLDDPRLFAIYAGAAERDLVLAVHTGINYGRGHLFDHEHPRRLDRVATWLPQLRIVAMHAGWPWAAEYVAVARKHEQVMLEFGGIAPKYLGKAGSGWEVTRQYIGTVLSDQAMFATDWPVMSLERVLGEWRALGLKDEVLKKVLGGNARRFFRLDDAPVPGRTAR